MPRVVFVTRLFEAELTRSAIIPTAHAFAVCLEQFGIVGIIVAVDVWIVIEQTLIRAVDANFIDIETLTYIVLANCDEELWPPMKFLGDDGALYSL